MVLPTLAYAGATKTNNEVAIYANLGVGILKKINYFGGSKTVTPCVAGEACPANSWDATFLSTIPNVGAVGTIPALSPLYSAAEGDQAPTVAGDISYVMCLPDISLDFLLCYSQGFQATPGQSYRPIPVKFNPVDHVVPQRSDNSLSLGDLFVSSWDGLQKIRGRRCTIIVYIYPNGGGQPQEIQYYTNAILNVPPMNMGDDGNASVTISGTGSYSFCGVFSAAKP